MRLSTHVSPLGFLDPNDLGDRAEEGMIRLPRRLSRYFAHILPMPLYEGRGQGEIFQKRREIMEFLRKELAEVGLSELLDQARSFDRGARTFRRRSQRRWRVGDPCYINGEGHGCLYFIQVIDGYLFSAGNGWENLSKAYRPTYLELFGHLLHARWNLRHHEAVATRFTSKQLQEQPRRVQDEVNEATRLLGATRTSLTHLEAWMRS